MKVQLPPSTGVDDTTEINAALATSTHVTGTAGETYLIGSPVVIGSGTTLDMTGCSVTELPGSNSQMLRNTAATGPGRDSNITIIGGTWNRGANAGGGNNRHNLFLRHVDRITVIGVRVTSTGGKYAIAIGDATQVTVHDVSFDTASDGVHLTGPIAGADIRNIHGTTGDDFVSFTPRDYAAYDDTAGDIRNVTVEGLYPVAALAAVKIAGGTGAITEGLSVHGVYGSTRIHPISIQEDLSGPTVANGILIQDVDVSWSQPYSPVWLRNITSTDVTLRDIRLRPAAGTPSPLSVSPMVLADGVTRIGSLTIDGWLVDTVVPTAVNLVGVFGTAHVGALRINRVRTPVGIWTGLPYKVGTAASVDSAVVADVYAVTY